MAGPAILKIDILTDHNNRGMTQAEREAFTRAREHLVLTGTLGS